MQPSSRGNSFCPDPNNLFHLRTSSTQDELFGTCQNINKRHTSPHTQHFARTFKEEKKR
ncbi:hypothetical protein GHT06_019809 [Daphnia sinensis]|uniref:Uncharacterized protein n=1 Tax=Daphnia sinensis TaxID=1820382 RepID=A0AAD5PNY9_9CRUS|nr:hypothetical protein GHT06_019809 [Daphnia sinensis]